MEYINNFIWESLSNNIDNNKNQIKLLKILMQLQIHEEISCISPLCSEIHKELAYEIIWKTFQTQDTLEYKQPFKINYLFNNYMVLFNSSENLNNFVLYNGHIVDKYGLEFNGCKNKKYITLEEISCEDIKINDFIIDEIIEKTEIYFEYILHKIKNI